MQEKNSEIDICQVYLLIIPLSWQSTVMLNNTILVLTPKYFLDNIFQLLNNNQK